MATRIRSTSPPASSTANSQWRRSTARARAGRDRPGGLVRGDTLSGRGALGQGSALGRGSTLGRGSVLCGAGLLGRRGFGGWGGVLGRPGVLSHPGVLGGRAVRRRGSP